MDEKQLAEISGAVSTVVEKTVPAIVDAKIAEALAKSASDLEEVKKAIKEANLAGKQADPLVKEAFVKTAVVSIFKEVVETDCKTEKQFESIVDKTVKAMSEGTATAGAELVFDQFETDILRVINSFDLLADVRILPITKGDKVSIPSATNGITTYYVDEAAAYTGSDATTAFISIDIKKIATLTDMTEELLDDTMTVPDLYNLIVEFIGESQAEFLETKVVGGTGAIVGITQTASVNLVALAATETSANLSDDDIVKVITSIPKKYGRNKKFLFSQYILGRLMAIKTSDGYPLYPELRNENPTLIGKPVIISDVDGIVQDSTDDVADAVLAIFGDFRRFTLVRRKGLTLERGYHGDNWKKDIQSLKSNQRAGGKVTFPKAFTLLKNGPVA